MKQIFIKKTIINNNMKFTINKKGQIAMPKFLNFILGIILLGVGAVGLFGEKIGFTMPEIPAIIFSILIGVGGLFLVLDAFLGTSMMSGMNIMPKSINMIIGFIVLIAGGILLLLDGILGANNMGM